MTDQVRGRIPETRFTEIGAKDGTVALISDVSNERAWIQSTEAVAVER